MLFSSYTRTDTTYKNFKETDFEFYDRSAIDTFVGCRELISTWFDEYPVHAKNDLRGGFKSDFDAAFFELFVFRFFRQSGFSLVPHPTTNIKSTKPDFLVNKVALDFYLEAKVDNDMTESEKKAGTFKDAFYHELNKTKSANFFFCIHELEFKSKAQPSLKAFRAYAEPELSKKDPDEVRRLIDTAGIDHPYVVLDYEDANFHIVIYLMPKPECIRGDLSIDPVGMHDAHAEFRNPHESIKTSLLKKASRYGAFDKPFIIALNTLSRYGQDEFTINDALFGDSHFIIGNDPAQNNIRSFRTANGAFHQKCMNNVSAVLLTRVYPMSLEVAV